MIRKLLLAAALVYPTLAVAQSGATIRQNGNVTPGHAAEWTSNGIVQDAGTAASGSLTSLGVTASGAGICQNSAAITATAWQALCLGVTTASGATINLNAFGTATTQNITSNATWQMPSLILPQGSQPVAPVNGQLWTTNAGVFAYISGGVVGPFGTGGGGGGTPGGINGQVQYNNAGSFGGLTNAQLTADINVATTSLSGAVPAWPNNTTTFFRGDGTYAALVCANLPALTGDLTSSGCATTFATVNSNVGTWGSATQIPILTVNGKGLVTAATQTALTYSAANLTGTTLNASVVNSGLTSVGTLVGGAAGAGFTVQASNTTWTGTVPAVNLPAATSSTFGVVEPDNSTITISGGVLSAPGSGGGTVSNCAQYAIGYFASAGTTLGCLVTANSAILATSAGGVPSLATALPTSFGINASNITWSGTISSSVVPNANLAASGNGGVTGNLPASNLNSGTGASAASFWRGDASWVPVGGQNDITNCTLVASVAANALTVAIKTQAGSDPSSSAPCIIAFRNATIATGDYTLVSVTAATSFATGTSGSTFGSANGAPFRLWITAWNNAGAVVLGVSKQSSTARTFPLNEGNVQSSTACNACTNAASSGVFYTTSAQSNKAIRILGYMDWASGLTTAGTWASGPTTIQLMGPGVKKPGDVVQILSSSSTGVASLSMTPTASMNLMLVQASWGVNQGTSGSVSTQQITRNGSGIGLALFGGVTSSAFTTEMSFSPVVLDAPQTTSSTTYSGATNVGSIQQMFLTVQEIQG